MPVSFMLWFINDFCQHQVKDRSRPILQDKPGHSVRVVRIPFIHPCDYLAEFHAAHFHSVCPGSRINSGRDTVRMKVFFRIGSDRQSVTVFLQVETDELNGILRVVINRQNRIEKGASKLYYMDSTEW